MSERKIDDAELKNISGGAQDLEPTGSEGGDDKVGRVKLPRDVSDKPQPGTIEGQ